MNHDGPKVGVTCKSSRLLPGGAETSPLPGVYAFMCVHVHVFGSPCVLVRLYVSIAVHMCVYFHVCKFEIYMVASCIHLVFSPVNL